MDETRESIDYQRVSEHSFFIYHICILNVCIGRFIMTKASIPIDGLVLGDRWASLWWSNCTRWGWCSGWIRRNCQGKFYTLNIFIFEIHVFIIWLNSCEYEINSVRIFLFRWICLKSHKMSFLRLRSKNEKVHHSFLFCYSI